MPSGAPPDRARAPRGPLSEVARLFAWLGIIGFGGPAAHIAMMRREVVTRRGWVDDQEFLDLVGATNLIPGPNSTELAIHLGNRRAGWRGLVVAGVTFILPAVVIVTLLAWLYVHHGRSAAFIDLRYGILPVILAIVGQAIWGLARTAVKTVALATIALAATALQLLEVNPLLTLAGAAVLGIVAAHPPSLQRLRDMGVVVVATVLGSGLVGGAAGSAKPRPTDADLVRLFTLFLEIGAVIYGSGYVLLAFLQRDLVADLGWLTDEQLLDAVAIGQVTPGPVFTTATFVGFQVEGVAGAAVATLGIFLPSFFFVAALGPIVGWARRSRRARAALDSINAAALGLMAGVTIELADTALPDAVTVAVAVAALAVLVRWKPNSAWLVGAGALIGAIRLAT